MESMIELIDRLQAVVDRTGKAQQVWVEVWEVPENGGFTWRAELHEKPNESHRRISFWKTHYLLVGKRFIVSFYSNDLISRDYALEICAAILNRKVVLQIIDLTEIGAKS